VSHNAQTIFLILSMLVNCIFAVVIGTLFNQRHELDQRNAELEWEKMREVHEE